MRLLGLIARAINRTALPLSTNSYGSPARRTVHTASNITERHWVNDEEPVDEYAPTGFHQTVIDDVLGSRYRVLRKLGWGVYSTVWLVQHDRDQSYAALKLMSAVATDAPELHELEYLQLMRSQAVQHPGHSHVIQLRDHFYHEGPNGKHICIVTELLSEDLTSFSRRWKYDRIPQPLAKVITRQIILGLDYLHNSCGILHTDIKPSNVLFSIDDGNISSALSSLGPSDITTRKAPDGRLVSQFKSSPIPLPLPTADHNSHEAWMNSKVKLIDVGVGCWADKIDEHFTDLIQSPAVRAPEVCIGAGWGKAADIWSLGCLVYEMVMGKSLLKRDIQPESVPYLHTILFGDYPVDMIKRGKYSNVFFNSDGTLQIPMPDRMSLELDILKRGAPPNREQFIAFLKLMFVLDPENRASLDQLLAHEWLLT